MTIDPIQFGRQRRNIIGAAAAGASLTLLSQGVSAQSAPGGKLLVGFAAGGSVDALTRILAEFFTQKLGKPFIVENRVGAAGRLAVDAVKTAKPDGDTLLVCPSGPITLFPFVFKNLKYDPTKDLTLISRLTTFDVGIAVGPASGADTITKFVAWAKGNPTKASYGSSGAGTLLHFAGVSFAQKAGLTMPHVGYRGSAPAVIDVIGGQVPMIVAPLSDLLEQHRAGKLKVLGVCSGQRSPLAADIPTLKQEGIDLDVNGWFGIVGPASMPADLTRRLADLAAEAVNQPSVKERLLKMGMVNAPLAGADFLALQKRELSVWEAAVKSSGFTPED